jgi:N-acetylmuramoyl-L-alanine amidase-like protein
MRALRGGIVARKHRRDSSRLLLVLALAVLAFVVWLAAPALSARPYVPDPVDFELRDGAPALKRSVQASSAGWRGRRLTVVHSRVLEAPMRFNVVGLGWRGAREGVVLLRARPKDGRWSRWTEVPASHDDAPDRGSDEYRGSRAASDPVWTGRADELQYRIAAPGPVRDVRLHFVNSTGTATPLERARSGLRRVAAGAVSAVASLLGTGARADTSQPEIVTREQWGASKCPPRDEPEYGEVKLAFIHHTVTTNEYGPEDSAAIVLGICRYHRNSNGWDDIGYQFLVDKYGQVFEGRAGGMDQAVIGAQAQGYNSQSTGVSNLGTFSTAGQTEEGLAVLARLLSWKLAVHGVPARGTAVVRSAGGPLNRYPAGASVRFERISGHRDGDATACPGDGLYSQLPRLRGLVSPDPRATASLVLRATRRHIPYGRKARLAGALRGSDGSPLAGRSVKIQALGGARGPLTLATLATDSGGSFAKNVRLAFNRALQASFGGDPAVRAAQSSALAVGVRPRVTAVIERVSGSTVRPGQLIAVRGTVRPRKRSALLLVDRRVSGASFRRVARQVVRVRLGRARAFFRPRRTGEYRLRLGVPPDGRNLGARSSPLTVQVR